MIQVALELIPLPPVAVTFSFEGCEITLKRVGDHGWSASSPAASRHNTASRPLDAVVGLAPWLPPQVGDELRHELGDAWWDDLQAARSTHTVDQIATALGVSPSAVSQWIARARKPEADVRPGLRRLAQGGTPVDGRWREHLARIIELVGKPQAAKVLNVHCNSVYSWAAGTRTPRPLMRARIQRLAGGL